METCFKVHVTPDRAFIKIFNKASYLNCNPLRKFLDEQSKNGQTRFVLDFQECTSMDSTFLGIIVSVALRIRKDQQGGGVVLLNLRGRNLETVCNLGVHQITDVCSSEVTNETELENLALAKDASADQCTIYQAHKALMNLNAKNLRVFSDVVNYLEQKRENQ